MTQGAVRSEQGTGTTTPVRAYQDLLVWQKSFRLAVQIYRLTQEFPASELYGMTNQMRRAAYSVPTNLAEGYRRTRVEFRRFISIALASASELETFLLLAQELGFGDQQALEECLEGTNEILKMLHGLRQSLVE